MFDQVIVFGTLFAPLGLFVYGRWRYDLVALMSLLVVVSTGIVTGEEAFQGFGHPAVVTVAAVLVISRGLGKAGIVDMIAQWLERAITQQGVHACHQSVDALRRIGGDG